MAKNTQHDNPGPADVPSIEDLSFEQAVERLERIIDRVESGESGLEESIREYELGMRLLKHCRTILGRAEQRVIELTPDAISGADAPTGRRPAKADEEPPF